MKRWMFSLLLGFLFTGTGWALQFHEAKREKTNLPRVLLIGDSICNGYRSYVQQHLKDRANVDAWVTGANLNGSKLHAELAEVLAKGPYDVVHFNIGLHGWPPGRIPDGQYEPLLRKYVKTMRKHGGAAKLIWASTTQITVKGKPTELDPEHNGTIVERNAIAARVMTELKIQVNDLYGLMLDKLALAAGDRFHWNQEAKKIQGRKIAQVVGDALRKDGS